jgi:predicted Zn-dependent peptidase
MRLVFASGTAADSAAHRGTALAAAKALEWDPRHLNDFLLFVAGGGTEDVSIDADHTVFSARGIDMHLDLLLAGLRRLVRDGRISVENVQAIRDGALSNAKGQVLADAWRASMFGAAHPYAHESTVSAALTLDDVKAFRKEHHTPDNATLVIAGRFDADLADRWIDYLFGDWTGAAPQPQTIATAPQPASFARDDEARAQVFAAIAIPATHGERAQQLVAADMFQAIARDVRHQLGVSYAIDAVLDESRLARTYVLTGEIDAAHTREALALVQTRLAALRSDADATARAFITARKRVLATLLRSTSSASELADRVERDVELARPPLSDLQTADAVNRLTIDAMGPALEDLDLVRAAIILRGPHASIDDGFAALGRTPTRFATPLDDEDPLKKPSTLPKLQSDEETFRLSDIEDPITLQTTPLGSRWLFGAYAGYTLGRAISHDANGYSVGADVGYRFTRTMAAGLHASIAFLDGTYPPESVIRDPIEISMRPVRVGAFLQASAYDRLWGNVFVGASVVRVTDDGMSESKTGLGYGIEGGFDVLKLAGNRLTLYGRLDTELASSASYAAFTVGLGYRR